MDLRCSRSDTSVASISHLDTKWCPESSSFERLMTDIFCRVCPSPLLSIQSVHLCASYSRVDKRRLTTGTHKPHYRLNSVSSVFSWTRVESPSWITGRRQHEGAERDSFQRTCNRPRITAQKISRSGKTCRFFSCDWGHCCFCTAMTTTMMIRRNWYSILLFKEEIKRQIKWPWGPQ